MASQQENGRGWLSFFDSRVPADEEPLSVDLLSRAIHAATFFIVVIVIAGLLAHLVCAESEYTEKYPRTRCVGSHVHKRLHGVGVQTFRDTPAYQVQPTACTVSGEFKIGKGGER